MIHQIAGFIPQLRRVFWSLIVGHFGGKIEHGVAVYEGVKMFTTKSSPIFVGRDCQLQKGAVLSSAGKGKIVIGPRVYVGEYVIVSSQEGVEIGEDVILASHTYIVDFNHRFDDLNRKIADQGCDASKVRIEKNVWIGAGCKILKGVTIGEGSVIGAGSVVTKDVPPNSVCVGVPAKVIRKRQQTVAPSLS